MWTIISIYEWLRVASSWGYIQNSKPMALGGLRSWYACYRHYDSSAVVSLMTLWDLPISAVFDVILLPLTLPYEFWREARRPK